MMVERRTWNIPARLIVALAVIIVMIPFLWTLLTSLKYFKDVMSGSLLFEPTLSNYEDLFFSRGSPFPRFVLNSAIIGISSTVLAVSIGFLAAYSVARFQFPFKIDKILLGWALLVHMIHPMAMVLPVFVMMKSLGLYNTHLGLILMYATVWLPVGMWLMKGFTEDIPQSLEDNALIDGCSRFQVIYKIVLPLVAPGLAATIIFVFIFVWNEFAFALILTGDQSVMTLPPGMARLSQQYFIKYGEMSSAAFFSTIPVLILVLFVQKQIVRGLTFGAVKG